LSFVSIMVFNTASVKTASLAENMPIAAVRPAATTVAALVHPHGTGLTHVRPDNRHARTSARKPRRRAEIVEGVCLHGGIEPAHPPRTLTEAAGPAPDQPGASTPRC